MICFTSFTGQFLVFELRGNLWLEGLSLITSKSISNRLLEKPSTVSLRPEVSSSRTIGEEFFILLSSVLVKSILDRVARFQLKRA